MAFGVKDGEMTMTGRRVTERNENKKNGESYR